MLRQKLVIFCFFSSLLFPAVSQESLPTGRALHDYTANLTDNSDKSKGIIIINQDDRLNERIARKHYVVLENVPTKQISGFRVQVYSSNQQIAKSQAQSIEQKIKEKFPNLAVYVSFQSPFWKVRIGDCTSSVEAQSLRNDVKREFPEYAAETYVVKDKVNVPE